MQSLLNTNEALGVVTFPYCVLDGFSGAWLSVEYWSVGPRLTSDRVAVVLRDVLSPGDWAGVVL
jgi:hypothetical protein